MTHEMEDLSRESRVNNNHVIPEIRVFSPSRNVDDAGLSFKRSEPMIPWKKTFDMRMVNLANFPSSSSNRVHHRSNLVSRAKSNVTTSSAKSLNLLRASLQKSLNQDLDAVMQKYLKSFFRPAAENIKKNSGDQSVSEYHLQAVCRTVLDEAKKMYFTPGGSPSRSDARSSSPFKDLNRNCSTPTNHLSVHHDCSDTESNATSSLDKNRKRGRCTNNSNGGNLFLSDNESEDLNDKKSKKRKKTGLEGRSSSMSKSRSSGDGVDRSGHRWDPERLTVDTKFVLGSKANKSLGFGQTRGRLYTKHPDLFRYIGDMEDRQWLSERGLMPPAGGRAYLLIKEDIEDLIQSHEYIGQPGVNAGDMGDGFLVPQFMLEKMKVIMSSMQSKNVKSASPTLSNHSAETTATETPSRPQSRSNEVSLEDVKPSFSPIMA